MRLLAALRRLATVFMLEALNFPALVFPQDFCAVVLFPRRQLANVAATRLSLAP
jgi:hypothetical protein